MLTMYLIVFLSLLKWFKSIQIFILNRLYLFYSVNMIDDSCTWSSNQRKLIFDHSHSITTYIFCKKLSTCSMLVKIFALFMKNAKDIISRLFDRNSFLLNSLIWLKLANHWLQDYLSQSHDGFQIVTSDYICSIILILVD